MAALNEYAVTKVSTVTGINACVTGTTLLYTVPSGKSFIPQFITIRCTALTLGAKATQTSLSVGTNSSYNNFIWLTSATVATLNCFQCHPSSLQNELSIHTSLTSFTLNISTYSNATTETWAIDTFGYLL